MKVIKGRIVDKTQQHLSPATVTLVDTANKEIIKTTTGNTGNFHFSYNVKGLYALIVSFTGYKKYWSDKFELEDKDFGTITLIDTTNALKEVLVKSKLNLVKTAIVSINI